MAWKPPECHVLNAICGVSVGLCAEYDVCGGFQSAQVAGSFSGSRYSAFTVGTRGSEMSTIRAHPQGQPWPDPVAVPYTSSETQTQSRSQSLIALCAPGPDHVGRASLSVIGRGCGEGVPFAKSDTSTTANPPVSSAKYAVLPSLLTVSECRPPVGFCAGAGAAGNRVKPCSPLKRVVGDCPFRTGEMSQTENGQLGEPPLVPHVEPALPANSSARSGFPGSSHRKNSWVFTLNWLSSCGVVAFAPEMS